MRSKLGFFSAIFFFLAFGSLRAQGAGNATPIYVVLGGFGSCSQASGARAATSRFLDSMAGTRAVLDQHQGRPSHVVTSCFGRVGLDFDFRASSDRQAAQETGIAELLRDSPLTRGDFNRPLDLLEALVRDEVTASPGPVEIFVMGHSYGGWLSLQLALRLTAGRFPLAGLVAFDPISPVTCSPKTFIEAGLWPAAGCTRAPTDLTEAEFSQIAAGAPGGVRNFFQTQYRLLHSGPIAAWDKDQLNQRFRLGSSNPVYSNQHARIADDPVVWKKVEELFLTRLTADQAPSEFNR